MENGIYRHVVLGDVKKILLELTKFENVSSLIQFRDMDCIHIHNLLLSVVLQKGHIFNQIYYILQFYLT